MSKAIIRRTAERELSRRDSESENVRRMDELKQRSFWWRMRKRIAIEGNTKLNFLVAMRLGDTPVLIPNTMVKT